MPRFQSYVVAELKVYVNVSVYVVAELKVYAKVTVYVVAQLKVYDKVTVCGVAQLKVYTKISVLCVAVEHLNFRFSLIFWKSLLMKKITHNIISLEYIIFSRCMIWQYIQLWLK